jgi:hypothetical protein
MMNAFKDRSSMDGGLWTGSGASLASATAAAAASTSSGSADSPVQPEPKKKPAADMSGMRTKAHSKLDTDMANLKEQADTVLTSMHEAIGAVGDGDKEIYTKFLTVIKRRVDAIQVWQGSSGTPEEVEIAVQLYKTFFAEAIASPTEASGCVLLCSCFSVCVVCIQLAFIGTPCFV